MKMTLTKKTVLLLSVFALMAVSTFFIVSCDNRKDFLGTSEKNTAIPPTINIRRFESGNPFINTLMDTFLLSTNGYKLEFQLSGIYVANTLKLSCTSNCDSLISTSLHADSSYFNIQMKKGSTVTFQVSVRNIFNETATAFFSLTYKNGRPLVNINKYSTSTPFGKTLSDSCDYGISPMYNIGFTYSDDNSTWTSLHCKKVNTTDASTITIYNGEITVNYGGINTNNIYEYKIYGEDPLGATSDTCYATIICYNKAPAVHIRPFGSTIAWSTGMVDTFAISPTISTYSMGLEYSDDNSTFTSCHVVKQTLGDPGVITVTNGLVSINYGTLTTYRTFKYKIYGVDPFGVTGDTCNATVVCYNHPPMVYIKPFGSTMAWTTSNADTFAISPTAATYSLGLDYIDANSTYTSCHVVKQTTGDPGVITVTNGLISINYSSLTTYRTFKYKIYGVDPYGATGDTCYATVACYDHPPIVSVRPTGSTMAWQTTLTDTLLFSSTNQTCYLALNYISSNSTYTNCHVVKQTLGDPAVISLTSFYGNNLINLNYGSLTGYNTFRYKIYGVDAYGATGDTCYVKIICTNLPPVIKIRPYTSSIPYTQTLSDTCHYPLPPQNAYNIGFTYTDANSTYSSMQVVKQTLGDPGTITVSPGQINLFYGWYITNNIFKYKIYSVDPYGATSDTCYATIIYFNHKPVLHINKTGFPSVINLTDSFKTTPTPIYTLGATLLDEAGTTIPGNVFIIPQTSGVNAAISKNTNSITFDYTSATWNQLYSYLIYAKDAQGLYSDTCLFTVYVLKNRPPVFVSHNSASPGSQISVSSSGTQPATVSSIFQVSNYARNPVCCGSGSGVSFNSVPSPLQSLLLSLNITAYDPDSYGFGDYITKIRFQPITYYTNITNGSGGALVNVGNCLNYPVFFYAPYLIDIYSASSSNYTLNHYAPITYNSGNATPPAWFWNGNSCGNMNNYNPCNYNITLYDNSGDSTVVPNFQVFY
ncbi:MAG: hypothetical protein ACYDEC_07570 [Bacteroidia bacterium]